MLIFPKGDVGEVDVGYPVDVCVLLIYGQCWLSYLL